MKNISEIHNAIRKLFGGCVDYCHQFKWDDSVLLDNLQKLNKNSLSVLKNVAALELDEQEYFEFISYETDKIFWSYETIFNKNGELQEYTIIVYEYTGSQIFNVTSKTMYNYFRLDKHLRLAHNFFWAIRTKPIIELAASKKIDCCFEKNICERMDIFKEYISYHKLQKEEHNVVFFQFQRRLQHFNRIHGYNDKTVLWNMFYDKEINSILSCNSFEFLSIKQENNLRIIINIKKNIYDNLHKTRIFDSFDTKHLTILF